MKRFTTRNTIIIALIKLITPMIRWIGEGLKSLVKQKIVVAFAIVVCMHAGSVHGAYSTRYLDICMPDPDITIWNGTAFETRKASGWFDTPTFNTPFHEYQPGSGDQTRYLYCFKVVGDQLVQDNCTTLLDFPNSKHECWTITHSCKNINGTLSI